MGCVRARARARKRGTEQARDRDKSERGQKIEIKKRSIKRETER